MEADLMNDDAEIVLVRTEFVWAEGASNDVKLCGAWNGWIPEPMFLEGDTGVWSLITPVPLGMNEFKFIVDGTWRTSSMHPIVGDKADPDTLNNLRVVRGKPDPKDFQADRQRLQTTKKPKRKSRKSKKKKKGCC